MGITDLKKLIGTTGVAKPLSSYRGKRVGVDASIYLYKFIYRDDPQAVLRGILRQLLKFHRHQITPVYIFDGKASSDIKIEVERRQERREKVRNTLETLGVELEETLETLGDPVAAAQVFIEVEEAPLGNAQITIPFNELDVPLFEIDSEDEEMEPNFGLEEEDMTMVGEFETTEDLMRRAVRIQSRIMSLQKQARRPTRELVQDCIQIFEYLGVPYVQAPGESDVTMAAMMQIGEVDAIVSEDTDMLPYGCEVFITGFSDLVGQDTVTEYKLTKVLDHLQLSRKEFVDVCILCGCDYAEKIYKVGVKTGYAYLKRYKSIEAVLEHIAQNPKLRERHTYPKDFLEQVCTARNMFLTGTPDASGLKQKEEIQCYRWNFELAIANSDDFSRFLETRHLNNVSYSKLCSEWRAPSGGAQKTIMDFFNKNPSAVECKFTLEDDDE